MPIQIIHMLYRILFSALILLSLLWLTLADWPAAPARDPLTRLDNQRAPGGVPVQTGVAATLPAPPGQSTART